LAEAFTATIGTLTIDFTEEGDYNYGAKTFVGTVTLINSSGGDVEVQIPSGVTVVNTGPDITVIEPYIYQSVTISGAVAGSIIQLYDTTSSTQLYLGYPEFPYTWTDPDPYADDRAIRLRVMYVDGATAKKFIDTNIGAVTDTSPSVSYLVQQEDDVVYNANAIDGSAVTGVEIDDALLRVMVSVGTITWQDLYAYETYWLGTEDGIVDEGRYAVAVDTANYKWYNFKIKNTSDPSVPLVITGGYGVDGDTGESIDMIDTTGGTIILAPDHVVPAPGSTGLTLPQFLALK
jgi:hypothetical protein